MPYVVCVSLVTLLNDQLGVINNKNTEQQKTTIQMDLVKEERSNKDVDETKHEEHCDSRSKNTSKVQEAPLFSIQGTQSEAPKDQHSGKEGCDNNAWINLYDKIHQWTKTQTRAKSKSHKNTNSLCLIFAIMWSQCQSNHETK